MSGCFLTLVILFFQTCILTGSTVLLFVSNYHVSRGDVSTTQEERTNLSGHHQKLSKKCEGMHRQKKNIFTAVLEKNGDEKKEKERQEKKVTLQLLKMKQWE